MITPVTLRTIVVMVIIVVVLIAVSVLVNRDDGIVATAVVVVFLI